MEVEYKTMSFEELLLESIDEGLSSLGETCKQAIYFHLEKEFKLNKRDITFRIKDFAEAIENIFGVGAKVLEIRIMKNLFKNMGYPFLYFPNQEYLEFTKYLESARVNKNRLDPVKELKIDQYNKGFYAQAMT
jgi:uncharacterized protein YjbK